MVKVLHELCHRKSEFKKVNDKEKYCFYIEKESKPSIGDGLVIVEVDDDYTRTGNVSRILEITSIKKIYLKEDWNHVEIQAEEVIV